MNTCKVLQGAKDIALDVGYLALLVGAGILLNEMAKIVYDNVDASPKAREIPVSVANESAPAPKPVKQEDPEPMDPEQIRKICQDSIGGFVELFTSNNFHHLVNVIDVADDHVQVMMHENGLLRTFAFTKIEHVETAPNPDPELDRAA